MLESWFKCALGAFVFAYLSDVEAKPAHDIQ
jgi:hypothetical protein